MPTSSRDRGGEASLERRLLPRSAASRVLGGGFANPATAGRARSFEDIQFETLEQPRQSKRDDGDALSNEEGVRLEHVVLGGQHGERDGQQDDGGTGPVEPAPERGRHPGPGTGPLR